MLLDHLVACEGPQGFGGAELKPFLDLLPADT